MKIKVLCFSLIGLFYVHHVQADVEITGRVVDAKNTPLKGALVTIQESRLLRTDSLGYFSSTFKTYPNVIKVMAEGYETQEQNINGREQILFVMNDDDGKENSILYKKGFRTGDLSIDAALNGTFAGLHIQKSSGMPGEGSYMNFRGVHTLEADNMPLLVINGVPYFFDKTESQLLGGYTRNIFQAYNLQDIQSIRVLKGAELSLYGSLGSNGVILIETEKATAKNMETTVSYYGQVGYSWQPIRLPMLEGQDYTSYLSDIGMNYFGSQNKLFSAFPFLNNPNNPLFADKYNNSTHWQDVIFKDAFTTDQLVRIEGGDNIAKYDLSLGYLQEEGGYKNTERQRYHAKLNGNVMVSKTVNVTTDVSLAYQTASLQIQGMAENTNPLLSALKRSPLLSPYAKDDDGNLLKTFSDYGFGETSVSAFRVSNPLAIVNTVDAHNRQFDLNTHVSVSYTPVRNLTLSTYIGFYYNYNNEHLFIPGTTNKFIVPLVDGYGTANNMVKDGVGQTFNLNSGVNVLWKHQWNQVHDLNLATSWTMLMNKEEYDAGEGRNTASDFYQTLGNTTSGRHFLGYINTWNWMNINFHADYTWKRQWQATVNISVDGASSVGENAERFLTYPAVGVKWMAKQSPMLQNLPWLNQLDLHLDYGLTGNSRYASMLGKYYYHSQPYKELSTIVRQGISNPNIRPEQSATLDFGFDIKMLYNRLSLSAEYYDQKVFDLICAKPMVSIYGSYPYYDNVGEMRNSGFELSLELIPLYTRNWKWTIGGNVSFPQSKIENLGGVNEIIYKGNDDMEMLTTIGQSPYQFYGYRMVGVFASQADADEANLSNMTGKKFQAGDVQYVDVNGDGKISHADRVVLGSAMPDYFGGFYSSLKYKNWQLNAHFTYSVGNEAYNALRRQNESMSTISNQAETVRRRWTLDGQQTDVPRVLYGDAVGNSDFSSRWIEDASYLRMKNLALCYTFDHVVLNFFRSGTLYISAENLFTLTHYLGYDAEFSYSYGESCQGVDYGKMPQSKQIKIGMNLKF